MVNPFIQISGLIYLIVLTGQCPLSGVSDLFLITVKILKFGTPQTIAIIVLKIEKFDATLH